jgi:hypothetical protein
MPRHDGRERDSILSYSLFPFFRLAATSEIQGPGNGMTPNEIDEIRQVVGSIVRDNQIAVYWHILTTLVIAGSSAYFGAYFSMKGRNFATKEHLGQITNEIKSLEFKYATQLESYKKDLEKRFEAEKVADLLARAFYEDQDLRDFNRLNWELSLYLPREIVCEISQKLVKQRTPDEAMKLLIMVREHFGIKDGLQWDNIAYSVPDKKKAEATAGALSAC